MNDLNDTKLTRHLTSQDAFGFLVFGVPRSGTTLFAKVLNGHPDLLCGSERFHGHTFGPASLTREGFRTLDLDRKAAAPAMDLLNQKTNNPALVFGEKSPRAYMHIDEFLPQFREAGRQLRMIVLLRDVGDIANSWYRRAANAKDTTWHRGMRGIFPYLESTVLAWKLGRIERPEDVLLVSYARLVDPDTQPCVLDRIAAHLGVSSASQLRQVMADEAQMTQASRTRNRNADPVDFTSDHPFFDQFPRTADAEGTVPLSKVQAQIRHAAETILTDDAFIAGALDHLRTEANPDVRAYQAEIAGFYDHVFSGIDPALGKALHGAMIAQPAKSQVAARTATGTRRFYDITDTVNFFKVHGTVTGIQRVQLDALSAISDPETFVAYLDADRGWLDMPLDQFNACIQSAPDPRAAVEQILGQMQTFAETPFTESDVIFLLGATWATPSLFESLVPLRLKGVRCVFFLHDILPLQVPEHFTAGHAADFKHWLKAVLTAADGIVCNSEETRDGLLEHTRYDGPVEVSDLNILPTFIETFQSLPATDKAAPLEKLGLAGRDYVLMVGTLEPRKNHGTALNVWTSLAARMGKDCPCLVLVGKNGWMTAGIYERIEEKRFPGSVMVLQDVNDLELAALYRNALFTLSISRREGWGLPITESLASGTPCVVGNQSAAKAATQGLAIEVDALSERDITDRLSALLADRPALDAMRDRIREDVRFRTWEDFANDLQNFSTALPSPAKQAAPYMALNRACTYGTDQPVDLSSTTPTGQLFRSGLGWNSPDDWGNWSRKPVAELAFGMPGPGPYSFYAVVTASLAHGTLPLTVAIGDSEWHGTLAPNKRSLVVLNFDHPPDDSPCLVTFRSGAPIDFSLDESHPDRRTLGFALIETRLVDGSDTSGRLGTLEHLLSKYLAH
ncbi:glycosyltransferase [Primorskyibacter sp. 2E107]|uniref:glycosyltransferase n=1 Tax=Primorskyibacter sp. 2E107 TaxID=3403458 RepID=UPI003AF6EE96